MAVVNQLEHQVRHIAGEILIWEGESRATSTAAVDELSEFTLSGDNLIKVDPLSITRRVVGLCVKDQLVPLD